MGGNYDEWAGRDSIFRNKLSNLRRPTGPMPAVPARAALTNEQYLQNLTNQKTSQQLPATPPAAPAAAAAPATQPSSLSIEDAERIAMFDSLTGLHNWRFFMRTLAYEMKRGERYRRPLAIVLVAVDGMQTVRSSAGNDPADFLLKSTVGILKTCIRDADIAAAYGDSLIVLFPETNAAGLTTVAERIRQKVRTQQVMHAMQNYTLTVSVGAAAFPQHARTPDDLIRRAQQCLQMAMERGGDKVCL